MLTTTIYSFILIAFQWIIIMKHDKLDYEGIQFWLTPPLLARRLENCLTSNPVTYLSTYVAKHFLTEWNSGCDVTSVP